MTVSMTEALTADKFHYGTCIADIGKRGGVTIRREEWRRNGVTKTWSSRPGEFRVPIKYGMRTYDYLTDTNADMFHTESACKIELRGETDKAPAWILREAGQ